MQYVMSALAIRGLDYLHLKRAHAKLVEFVGCQIATTTPTLTKTVNNILEVNLRLAEEGKIKRTLAGRMREHLRRPYSALNRFTGY